MTADPASRWDDEPSDPLGDWLGTCGDCGLPMWSNQELVRVDGSLEHNRCERPGGVVSPEPTTTKGTTMGNTPPPAYDLQCNECDHIYDRHQAGLGICLIRDCECSGFDYPKTEHEEVAHDAEQAAAAGCRVCGEHSRHLVDCAIGRGGDGVRVGDVDDSQGDEVVALDTAWFCDTAKGIIGNNGQRRQDYGDAVDNFGETGKLWAAVFGHDVTAEQVALCMILVKLQRLTTTITHTDSWVDIIGYAALGGAVAHIDGRN